MALLREHLTKLDKLHYKYQKAGWFLDAVATYCDAVRGLAAELACLAVRSGCLLGFRDYLADHVASDRFSSLAAETEKLKADLAGVRYCLIIRDGSIKVRAYEDEIDYSAEVTATFEKFKQEATRDYSVKRSDSVDMNHVEAALLDLVARLYPEVFSALDGFCARRRSFQDEAIQRFDREIQFYVAYLDQCAALKRAGLPFCYPALSDACKEVRVRDAFDLALARKLVGERVPVICNDFHLEGGERIIVVSGPNQGGKTTFARMFGQLHYLASLGCPVPGSEAQLYLCDRLFTHFEREEDIETHRGKLEDDIMRIHEALSQATPRSIIVMNEIFTSTTLRDAIFLSKKILEKIMQLNALCVCVTFIDELASLGRQTVSMVSTVVAENPALRTFKVVRKPADGLAYAMAIAEKYRLTYKALKERVP